MKQSEKETITVTFFKGILEAEKQRILSHNSQYDLISNAISKDEIIEETDLSSYESQHAFQLKCQARETLYLRKIFSALQRIQLGTFGECESCGDSIAIGRLKARPTATHCLSCKEEQEKIEMSYIDGHRSKSSGQIIKLFA